MNLLRCYVLLLGTLLLSARLAQAQRTPASRLLERLTFYGSEGIEAQLAPADSVATAVQLLQITQAPQPDGSYWVLYCYRPAFAASFYVKRFWVRIERDASAGADTAVAESRLMQVLPPLSARLARLITYVGHTALPPHSVHLGPARPPSPQEVRVLARQQARARRYSYTVRLRQAPPYRLAYRATLDPVGYEEAGLLRRLGRPPARYSRAQRGAYRRALRLVRDFVQE